MSFLANTGAKRQLAFLVRPVAVRGDPALHTALQPGVLGVENEVDDAGDRVRPVGCGGAAGDDFGALQQGLGHDVDVDGAVVRGGHHAAAIEQHQCTVLTEIAHVENRLAGIGSDAIVLRRIDVAQKLRQLLECFDDVSRGDEVQLLGGHDGHGSGRVHAGIAQAGTGDGDLLQ